MTDQELANAFRALGHEKRLTIFLQILEAERKNYPRECECVVSDVISKLGIGAPTISHHLKELAGAGLIETERDGKYLVARVKRDILQAMRERLATGNPAHSGRKA